VTLLGETATTISLRFYRTGTVAKLLLADTSAAAIGISSAEAAGEWFSAVDREEGGALAPKVTGFLRPEAQMWFLLFAGTGAELGENQVVTSKTLVAGKTWRRATAKYKTDRLLDSICL